MRPIHPVKKLKRKLWNRLTNYVGKMIYHSRWGSDAYVQWLRRDGARIGEGTTIFDPTTVHIDSTRPWMIEIGDNVKITKGVTILTHGFDWSVLKGKYGEVLGSCGKVTIGNNCFIGMNSTILKGVTIGDNVIVGANSLVNHDVPSDCVVGGAPAHILMTLDEYYEKRKGAQIREATELVRNYRRAFGRDPDEKAMSEFFWLFSNDADPDRMPPAWRHQMLQAGNEAASLDKLRANPKRWPDMQSFLDSID